MLDVGSKKKENFVRTRLSPLMVDAYDEVLGATYEVKGKSETVNIHYNDGSIVMVNVTGDSLPALVSDVLDKIVFN